MKKVDPKNATVKELFDVLDETSAPDEECRLLVQRIKDTLTAYENVAAETQLGYMQSIETFINNGKFATSRLGFEMPNIKSELNSILNEVKTWVKNEGTRGKVFETESKKQSQLRRQSSIGKRIIAAIGIAIGMAFIVLTILHLTGHDQFNDVPEIIGCVDLVIGIIFFIYERISDSKQNKLSDQAGISLKEGKAGEFIAKNKITNNLQVGDHNTMYISIK